MEEVVEMVLIFVVEEGTATFTDIAAFGVALGFKDVSWLEENLASVLVDLLEPAPQSLIPVRVIVQHIDRVRDLVQTPPVGEPFEKRPQFACSQTESRILGANEVNSCGQRVTRSALT